jgi:transcriptional regulator with XRE-family HTH domain
MDRLSPVLDTWAKRVGALLLILREQEHAKTRFELAQTAGIDPKTIKRIERGEAGVGTGKIEKYANSLGLSLDDVSAIAATMESTRAVHEMKESSPQPRAAVGERKRTRKARAS